MTAKAVFTIIKKLLKINFRLKNNLKKKFIFKSFSSFKSDKIDKRINSLRTMYKYCQQVCKFF